MIEILKHYIFETMVDEEFSNDRILFDVDFNVLILIGKK